MSIGGDEEPAGTMGPTKQERALAGVSRGQWQDYKKYGRPIERQLMEETERMGSPEMREKMASQTAATIGQEFNANRPQFQAGSNSFAADLMKHGNDKGAAVGLGVMQSGLDSESRYRAGAENIISMGRDIANQGIEGMTNAAQLAATKQRAASAAAQSKDAAFSGLIGTAVGAAGYGLADWMHTSPNERGSSLLWG
jgi:hypothetical protein